jgi:hypothetical protein
MVKDWGRGSQKAHEGWGRAMIKGGGIGISTSFLKSFREPGRT